MLAWAEVRVSGILRTDRNPQAKDEIYIPLALSAFTSFRDNMEPTTQVTKAFKWDSSSEKPLTD